MLHSGPIWYHSEPSDVPYSQNLPRPISWFGLFLQQNNSRRFQKCEVKENLVKNPSVPWNFAKNDTPLSITLSRFGWGKRGRHSVGGKPDNDYPPL